MLWSATITIDARIYSVHVVQKAAYALADTISILIQQSSQGLNLLVSPVAPSAVITEAAAHALLIRALNDFALREQVLKETSGIRELLILAALKEVGI